MEKKIESQINNINETILRYPFNGRSKYLIDKFYIMGFDPKTLYRNLIEDNTNDSVKRNNSALTIESSKSDSKKNPQIFHLDDPPTILNEITSDYKKQVPDKDLIKDMIFPNSLDFYWTEEIPNLKSFNSAENNIKMNKQLKFKRSKTPNFNNNNDENNDDNFKKIYIEDENYKYNSKFIKPYNVIFSYNPQTENSSKKSINGFAHIFYKKHYQNKIIGDKSIYFFIPIIFCIISEYPFYNSFYLLCNQFKNLFSEKTIEVPLEIIIYNIINFTLSPLNNDIELFIEPISFPSDQLELQILNDKNKIKIDDIKEVDEENSLLYVDKDKDEDINEEDDNNKSRNSKLKFKKTLKRQTQFGRSRLNTNYNTFNKEKMLNYSSNKDNFYEIKEHEENDVSGDISPDKIPEKSKDTSPTDKSLRESVSTDKNDIHKKIKVLKKNNKSNVLQTHIRAYSNNYNSVDLNLSNNSSSTSINVNDFKLYENIKFSFLPGYPLIQYNLVKVLLHILSPQDVIIIFFHTFLEKDVVFFSKDIEYLSLTIDAYLNLNFPLNDEKYYFFNACVSYENYINNNSTFVGSTFTTILGVNSQYPLEYKNTNMAKSKEHLCVDLDNGNLHYMKGNNSSNSAGNGNIFDYIKKICKNKDFKEERETVLCREIKKIFEKLLDYKNKLTNKNNNTEFYKNISNANLIDFNEDNRKQKKSVSIKIINKDIQESFYRLINNLCLYFYQNLTIKDEIIDKSKQKNNKKVQFKSSIRKSLINSINTDNMSIIYNKDYIFGEENSIYSKEELAFLQELTETMKFESFVYGFIQSYNPIDLYKVPLTFTEEFISILSRKNKNLTNINFKFLSLIDKLYEKNLQKKLYVDFNPFLSCYFKSYKPIFDREIYDIYNKNINNALIGINFKIKNDKKIVDNFKYKSYELDKSILLKYKAFINNLNKKEYRNIFYLSSVLEKNSIQTIQLSDIENEIEKYCIDIGLLTKNDVCCNNIILLFIMSIKDIIYKDNMDCAGFLYSISQNFIVFRKYYTMIMNILYQLMKQCLNENNYTLAKKYYFCFYPCINSLRNIKLVPNESLMNIIKKFNSIKINAIIEKEDIQRAKEIKDLGNNRLNINNKELPFNYKSKYVHLTYNFDKNKFYTEKEVIEKINEPKKDDLTSLYTNLKARKKFEPKIVYNDGNCIYKCKCIPQAKILEILTKEYITFYNNGFDEKVLNNKEIFNACLNIEIFVRNLDDFENRDYFIYSLQCIFDYCLNKLNKNKSNK